MFRRFLILIALVLPGVAHAQWNEANSRHFRVYAEGSSSWLEEFVDKLERFDSAVRYLRHLPDPDVAPTNRLTIFVVDDQGEVEDLYGHKGVAGFYRPAVSGPVAFVPHNMESGPGALSPLAVLLHEYSHHLMYSLFPNAAYPIWFSEGFAEFHATARFEKDGSVTLGVFPAYRGYSMSSRDMPATRMLENDSGKYREEETELLYGRGWLLTHYLTFGGKRDGQLEAYIVAVNEGKTATEAAQVFGNLSVLDRELNFYGNGMIPGRRVEASAIKPAPIEVKPVSKGASATMRLRIRLQADVTEESAPGVYAAAKAAAAPYPNDAAVQRMLAEAAYDAKDYPGAEAAADRALAADPDMADALVYKARAEMAIARDSKDGSVDTWVGIRRVIGSAIRLDPNDPEALMLYYYSFADLDGPVPKIAIDRLKRAFVLAPEVAGLRYMAASAFLDEGNAKTARMLLAPLRVSPHGSFGRAGKAIDAIDAGDLDAARRALRVDSEEDSTDGSDGGDGGDGGDGKDVR